MMLALRYLTCYLGTMVSVIMIFLTTAVAVAANPVGLTLAILLITVMSLMSLIQVTHPPAPPYVVALLFRQVRIRFGLPTNLNYIDDVPKETIMIDDQSTAAARTLIM